MELTVGILSYNTKDLLRRCLNSVFLKTKYIKFEVIVVDNASNDKSADMVAKEFPQVKLYRNKVNNYFAAGYNQIIKKAKGKYFIMLNSDAYIKDNAFKKIIDFMKRENIKACEGLEIGTNGKPILTGTKFRTLLSDFYQLSIIGKKIKNQKYLNENRMIKNDRRKSYEIEVGCNAYFCATKKLLDEIKGYDEKLVLYYTEDDLCQRIKKRGHEIFHCGESYVIHEEAKSTNQLGWKRINLLYNDLLSYHKKYNNKAFAYGLFLLLSIEKIIWKLKV